MICSCHRHRHDKRIGDEGQLVLVKDIKKDIIPGDYVELLAGIHSGKKGFVIGRVSNCLSIWSDDLVSAIFFFRTFLTHSQDVPAHINSVRLSQPDFCHMEMPWLDVHVKVMSGPFAAQRGVVTNVAVTSSRTLAITVRLLNGDECTFGYHAVREYL